MIGSSNRKSRLILVVSDPFPNAVLYHFLAERNYVICSANGTAMVSVVYDVGAPYSDG